MNFQPGSYSHLQISIYNAVYIYAGKMNLKTETTSIVSLNTSPSYQNATTSEVW